MPMRVLLGEPASLVPVSQMIGRLVSALRTNVTASGCNGIGRALTAGVHAVNMAIGRAAYSRRASGRVVRSSLDAGVGQTAIIYQKIIGNQSIRVDLNAPLPLALRSERSSFDGWSVRIFLIVLPIPRNGTSIGRAPIIRAQTAYPSCVVGMREGKEKTLTSAALLIAGAPVSG